MGDTIRITIPASAWASESDIKERCPSLLNLKIPRTDQFPRNGQAKKEPKNMHSLTSNREDKDPPRIKFMEARKPATTRDGK